jgi:C-terminal processing protease CtpA/Prc
MAALLSAAIACGPLGAAPARADNPMGYQLVTQEQAKSLPRGGGSVGLDVGAGQRITESGMSFEVMQVRGVRRGSPAAHAGFRVGDQIIAVDGKVFPSVAAFASYVGSAAPGSRLTVDYMPKGTGPQNAQRVALAVADSSGKAPAAPEEQKSGGMSTGTKIAIGAAAVALFGCYRYGCFGRSGSAGQASPQPAR